MKYFFWHFVEVPCFWVKFFANFVWHFWNYFSILELSRTLFSPWKRTIMIDETPGFSLARWATRTSNDLISRAIGACVRLMTIFTGLSVIAGTLLIGAFVFYAWLLLPIFTLLPYVYLRLQRFSLSQIDRALAKLDDFYKIWQSLGSLPFGKYFFAKAEINDKDYKEMTKIIKIAASNPEYQDLWREARPHDLTAYFNFLFKIKPLTEYLSENHIESTDLLQVVSWYISQEKTGEESARFWERSNLMKTPAIGKNWAFGYTLTLDKFSTSATRLRRGSGGQGIIGRKEEVKNLEQILIKDIKKNVLLVGPTGAGKKTIVEALANKITAGLTISALAYKRVLFFDLNALVSQNDTPEERRELLSRALKEGEAAGNIILAINHFDRFVSDGVGRTNLSSVLADALRRGKIAVIAISSLEDFHKFVAPNETIMSAFELMEVAPIKPEKAIEIVNFAFPGFTLPAIREIVDRSSLLITDVPFPEKAINLADEIISGETRSSASLQWITRAEVDSFLSKKLKVPLGALSAAEKNVLINLEAIMHRRLVNQTAAVAKIASAMQRGRLEIKEKHKPIGSFLFLGPTGVGKTECAKALAECYFGSEENMTRFDMSEYQDIARLEDFVGSKKTENYGVLIEKVKENPFAILLLDEIEKAAPQILNIFLTILDEGYLTDFKGNHVSFEHQIVIATSNAGAALINAWINEGRESAEIEKELWKSLIADGTFSPEFLNRFDAVVYFTPLSRENLLLIASRELQNFNQDLYRHHRVRLKITDKLLSQIVEQGYDPEFGARAMKRVITEKVSSQIAKLLLEGRVKAGEEIGVEI